jgi:hypothetical protein
VEWAGRLPRLQKNDVAGRDVASPCGTSSPGHLAARRESATIAAMGWLSDLLKGGSDEMGWDDLVRRVVDGVAGLRRYGARGEVIFPSEVTIRITVGGGSVDVVRGFLERPELDREVEAALQNRCDVGAEALPQREYVVSAADRTSVTVLEGTPKAWQFLVEGGDLDGRNLSLPSGWTEAAFGRGQWQGGEQHARNDLVICERTEFVSRRAGRLFRTGNHLEVAALDQGDLLAVRRNDGELVRPSRTARGRVAMKSGDAIEIADGRGACVRVVVQRVAQ